LSHVKDLQTTVERKSYTTQQGLDSYHNAKA